MCNKQLTTPCDSVAVARVLVCTRLTHISNIHAQYIYFCYNNIFLYLQPFSVALGIHFPPICYNVLPVNPIYFVPGTHCPAKFIAKCIISCQPHTWRQGAVLPYSYVYCHCNKPVFVLYFSAL